LKKDLTIIIPNWNGFPYLKDCIKSIKKADYDSNIEIIIVDNASTDGSLKWIERYHKGSIIVKNKKNLGFAKACNQGAKKAKSDYIIFLNSDMKVAPNFFKKITDRLDDSENIASISAKIMDWKGKKTLFTGASVSFYGHGFQIEKTQKKEETDELLFSCGGAALFNKKIFLSVGGFDEDYFAYFEDVDLGIRLNLMGHKIVFCPNAVVYHVAEASSKNLDPIEKFKLYERNALYTIIKNYSDNTLAKILPPALLLAFARVAASLNVDIEKNESISDSGLATIYAINEIIDNTEELFKKRNTIQKNRKVDDYVILQKFGNFIQSNVFDAEYYKKLLNLTQTFEIEKLFADSKDTKLHLIFDDFKNLLDTIIKRNESSNKEIVNLNKAISDKDIYIQRMQDNIDGLNDKLKVHDEIQSALNEKESSLSKLNETLFETREYLKEKDRQIKKLLDDLQTKEQFIKEKDEMVNEKEKEIQLLQNHISTQESLHNQFKTRQLDILNNLKSKLNH